MNAASNPAGAVSGSFYRAVWRWHFYAGLLVLPVLVWLAVTGGLYLYKAELERLVYRDWISVVPTDAPKPLAELVPAIGQAAGGTVTQIIRPAEASESWRMTVAMPSGERRTAFVDPYQGTLLGTTRQGGVMQTVRDLHSLIITGPIGNAVVEIVAGWAIILVLTGFYLWWPRNGSPVLGLRGAPRHRRFWRDFHASAGALAGGVILFLAVTGMPWSGMWGKNLQGMVAANEWGRPKAPMAMKEHREHEGRSTLPWSLQAAAPPHAHGDGDIGPDRVAALAAAGGFGPSWTMTLPAKEGDPYLLSANTIRAEDARILYVEPETGRVLQDAGYADFGPGARLIEWGIATHQGQEYGEPNRLVMLAGCIAMLLLAGTAPILWWKRRRGNRLVAPARSLDPRRARTVTGLMLALGTLFPLTGATMLAALVADRLWMGMKGKVA